MSSLERKNWVEFLDAGLLWWVNRALHLFGWAIVIEYDEETGVVKDAYPARCSFRGFSVEAEEQGFSKLTKHLCDSSKELLADVEL